MTLKILLFLHFLILYNGDQKDIKNSKDLKIDALAERYHDLGRFSGTILVADQDFVYQRHFGQANYELNLQFDSKTAFEIGVLSELFKSAIYRLMLKNGELNSNDKVKNYLPEVTTENYSELLQDLSKKIQLENTFFGTPANKSLAQGYTHNFLNGDVVLEASEANAARLRSTAADLLKLLKFLPEQKISMDGYQEEGGFSYGILKEEQKFIIVISNRRHPVAFEIITGVNAILEGTDYQLPLPRKEIQIQPELLNDYAGSYALNPEMHLKIVKSNDSLFVLMGPQKMHLIPQAKNQFYMEQGDSAIRFLRNGEGKVSSAELLDGFLTGNKIRKIE